MSVLDIGTFDGFYAFEAERRRARVIATDPAVWQNPYIGRSGFDLARRVLGSSVEDREVDVLELSPETVGPLTSSCFLVSSITSRSTTPLERVASVTRRQLIMETHVDPLGSRRPAAAFYPGEELQGDSSNWWGPNLAAAKGMLQVVGFSRVEVVSVSRLMTRLARAAKQRYHGKSALTALRQGRAVFHAFKDDQ